jgi:hypothetical protein
VAGPPEPLLAFWLPRAGVAGADRLRVLVGLPELPRARLVGVWDELPRLRLAIVYKVSGVERRF